MLKNWALERDNGNEKCRVERERSSYEGRIPRFGWTRLYLGPKTSSKYGRPVGYAVARTHLSTSPPRGLGIPPCVVRPLSSTDRRGLPVVWPAGGVGGG